MQGKSPRRMGGGHSQNVGKTGSVIRPPCLRPLKSLAMGGPTLVKSKNLEIHLNCF
jgi:hypothetical protein